MTMHCALCLYEADGRKPAPAVTIANGQAMCIGHFDNAKDWEPTSGGLRSMVRYLDDQL